MRSDQSSIRTAPDRGSRRSRYHHSRRRQHSKTGGSFTTACASLIPIVVTAILSSDGSASTTAVAAFVQHRSFAISPPHLTPANQHFASSSSSDNGNDGWSEVFQNAVSSLDKRLVVEDGMEKQRRDMIDENNSNNHISFVSPLLVDGYPPAVLEYERRNARQNQKPMLLYLPGFDGTILSPFLQFPSLGEEFDVRAMKVAMDDRSTFEELKETVIEYLLRECRGSDGPNGGLGTVYLMGESFGGILATEIALELNRPTYRDYIDLRGLVLVNPATSYLRSKLCELGPPIANRPSLPGPLTDASYVFSLVKDLIPLFLDEGRAFQQLITILSSKGLPSIVNNPQKEAYMGRVAFDLANRLKFMPKDTLKWRLEEWLQWGAGIFEDRLEMLQSARTSDNSSGDVDTYSLLKVSQELRTLIVVGELDLTLPSWEEADRLSNEVFRNAYVHVVPGAGHASTCGGSLNLMQLLREVFPETNMYGPDNDWASGFESMEELNGLEPRYDGASIGLNPFLYWSKDYYRKWRREE